MTKDLLTGTNIRLRALEPGDVAFLYEWENDTSVWDVSSTLVPFSKFQLEEYVLHTQNDIFASKQLRLMIVLTGSLPEEIPAGTIDLFDFDPIHHRAGVGILVRQPYREKGIALQAMKILINYSFTMLRLHQLFCNISPDNEKSIRLFTGLGFERCGIKREWINEGGTWKEEWMYQLIRHDE